MVARDKWHIQEYSFDKKWIYFPILTEVYSLSCMQLTINLHWSTLLSAGFAHIYILEPTSPADALAPNGAVYPYPPDSKDHRIDVD